MEYTVPVRDRYTVSNITKLKTVQLRTVRFVKDDHQTTSHCAGIPLNSGQLVMMYREVYKLAAIPTENVLIFMISSITTRNTISPSAIRLWNQLPGKVTEIKNCSCHVTAIKMALLWRDWLFSVAMERIYEGIVTSAGDSSDYERNDKKSLVTVKYCTS